MHRVWSLAGSLGLLLAATTARAAAPTEVTLFGQKYRVTIQSRAQKYRNGYTVTIKASNPADYADSPGEAALHFVQGADPPQDRLFIGCPTGKGAVADQLYVLTGADPNTGVFSPTTAAVTPFFGGKVNDDDGGRPVSVLWIRDPDPNVAAGKDRNFALTAFAGADAYVLYDQRTMLTGNFVDDAVFARGLFGVFTDFRHNQDTLPQWHLGDGNEDPNMPHTGFLVYAPGPNGTIVGVGLKNLGSSLEMGVTDPNKDTWYPVLTNLTTATASAAIKLAPPDNGLALVQVSDSEYRLLTSVGNSGAYTDDANGSEPLYRLRITFPADLANGKANSIKVEPIAMEDAFRLNLHSSAGGIFGMTAGRQRGTSGARDLYMSDWLGNLITLTPE